MFEQHIPLDEIHNYIDTAGVYEILCRQTNRIYIGQSSSITRRIHNHYGDLSNGRHSNKLLQREWDKFEPCDFLFKVVTEIPYTDVKALVKAERKEINLRRKHGVKLYNDFRLLKRPEEDEGNDLPPVNEALDRVRRASAGKGASGSTTNGNSNKPYVRPHTKGRKDYDEVTCYDCGVTGAHHDQLFTCDDGMIRCERCVDKYMGDLSLWIDAQDKIAKETKRNSRMRWQMFTKHFQREALQAISRYTRKHLMKPERILINREASVKASKVKGVTIEKDRYVPVGYLDLPLPKERKEVDETA